MEALELFSNKLFALFPERLCCRGIKRITTNAFADGGNNPVVRNDLAGVAVLTIPAADLIRRRSRFSVGITDGC
jgi:hypothetical protein